MIKVNCGLKMGKRTLLFLTLANILLVSLGWIMAIYAYPRLPAKIPMWVNLLDQQTLYMKKSILFFIYPLAQTVFCGIFWRLSKIKYKKMFKVYSPSDSALKKFIFRLKKEFVLLVLIFFNLIYIHLQRSIILISHGIEKGVSEYYFFSLFGIILILIPYYRIRKRIIERKKPTQRI
jgi:hypothetical protein